MATVYGSTIKSTWRSYLTYSIEETPTAYKVTVDNVGIDLTSTYVVGFSEHAHKGTLTVGSSSDYFTSSDEYTTDTSLVSYFTANLCTLIIQKTASTQTVKLSFSLYFQDWVRWNKSMTDGTQYENSTSTASVTLTIPALAKPTVVLTALRNSNVETTATFQAIVSSFSSDVISSVKLTVDGTAYSIGSGTVGSSGGLTFSKTITGLSIGRISASLVATGEGGSSDTYVLNVPPAFYTLDIGNKGKEIAFGQSATTNKSMIPSNGLFSCGMDADFQGNLLIQGNNLIEKLKKMLCTSYPETLTVTAGTFTNNGCVAALVGNILKLYISAKAKSAITAGNITNQTMLTITFTDSRIINMYPMSGSGGASGPNSQMIFGVSSSGGQHTITVVLAAIAQNLSSGGVIDANVSLPCVLDWDAY